VLGFGGRVTDRKRAFDQIRELAGMGEGSGNRVFEAPMRPATTFLRGSPSFHYSSCTFSRSSGVDT
jgi:hypothetical protein